MILKVKGNKEESERESESVNYNYYKGGDINDYQNANLEISGIQIDNSEEMSFCFGCQVF